jgi:hypothetical protein
MMIMKSQRQFSTLLWIGCAYCINARCSQTRNAERRPSSNTPLWEPQIALGRFYQVTRGFSQFSFTKKPQPPAFTKFVQYAQSHHQSGAALHVIQ